MLWWTQGSTLDPAPQPFLWPTPLVYVQTPRQISWESGVTSFLLTPQHLVTLRVSSAVSVALCLQSIWLLSVSPQHLVSLHITWAFPRVLVSLPPLCNQYNPVPLLCCGHPPQQSPHNLVLCLLLDCPSGYGPQSITHCLNVHSVFPLSRFYAVFLSYHVMEICFSSRLKALLIAATNMSWSAKPTFLPCCSQHLLVYWDIENTAEGRKREIKQVIDCMAISIKGC